MMDLFDDASARDQMYRHILESSHPVPQKSREFVNSLWSKTVDLLGGDLKQRVRFEFHACFWEMYLAAILLDQNKPIVPLAERRFRLKGPDIQVGQVPTWFEAIVATTGTGTDAVPDY